MEEDALIVVHRDEQMLVLDKPAGLLAVPGRGEAGTHNLWAMAERRWTGLRAVHRLDMATSGLMVFARDPASHRQLSIAFASREVDKRYTALVHAVLRDDEGEIDLPLAGDWPRRPRQRIDHLRGKAARTCWRVIARDESAARTRVELQPISGRTHQLRVHLAAIGHPIVGDALYAPQRHEPAQRLLLHAARLSLPHPRTASWMELASDAPF